MLKQTPKSRVLFVRKCMLALLVLFGVFLFTLINLRSPQLASAATANTVNFQARLQTLGGAIVPDGNYNVEFKLYSASSGGTALWTEDYLNSASQGLQTINGYLSANLGSHTSFSGINWDQQLWLTMNIGGTTTGSVTWDGEMNPRISLTAVPYAFSAGQLQTTSGANTSKLSIQAPTGGSQTFQIQDQGASGTYNLLTQDSTGVAKIGTASSLTGKITFGNAGSANTITLTTAAETIGSATITIPDTAGANDTVCLLTKANCGSTLSVGTLDGGTYSGNGASVASGTIYLQAATGGHVGLVTTTTQTFGGDKTFSGTTTLNNTTLASGTSITLTGSGTRPGSPTDGMLYYDTTTHQLLQYSTGLTKWVSDRTTAIIVAANNSSQAEKDAADYVATGTGDQAIINSALSDADPAGAGTPRKVGQVLLLGGTYNLTAAISVPNYVTLAGVGTATIITIPTGQNGTYNMISNTDTSTGTNVTIRDMLIDGNKANQASGNMTGIFYQSLGSTTTRDGGRITNVTVKNIMGNGEGIYLSGSYNTVVSNNVLYANGHNGINVLNGGNNTINANLLESNGSAGIALSGGSVYTITGNTMISNTTSGISTSGSATKDTFTGNTISGGAKGFSINATYSTLSGNNITGTTTNGIQLNSGGTNNVITGNKIHDVGGSSANNGISLTTASNNTITSNDVTDTACSSTCYAITITDSASLTNYLANNNHSGTTANPSTINDAGTGTIYANQTDGSGNLINKSQGGGFTIGAASASATLTIQGGTVSSQLSTPAQPTIAKSGGTNASATYGYKITALDGTGETTGSTEGTVTSGYATLTSTALNTITWSQVSGAVQYKVYRTTVTSGSPSSLGLVGTVSGNVLTFNDTGITATTAIPGSNTSGGGTFAGSIQGSSLLSTLFDTASAATLSIGTGTANAITLGKSGVTTTVAGALTSNGNTLVKLTSTTAFQIQDASTNILFTADTNTGTITLGTGANTVVFTASGGLVASGSAQHGKTITFPAEYAGAVLDAAGDASCSSANSGTMTAGFDNTNYHNYYKWVSTTTAQCYDIVVRVPIPSDWAAWSSTNPLTISSYTTNTTSGTIKLQVQNSASNSTETSCNYGNVTPGSTSTWSSSNSTNCTFASTTTGYSAGGIMTLRIRLTGDASSDVRASTITLNYKSNY